MEHSIAMEPMKGKWASSRVDLAYSELFCILEVTAVFLSSCDSGLGDSLLFHQAHCGSIGVCLENGIALPPMQGIRPHLPPRGISHGISRVVAGTWGIFSSYSRDGHSKLHFVQQSQDSCLIRSDTSGI